MLYWRWHVWALKWLNMPNLDKILCQESKEPIIAGSALLNSALYCNNSPSQNTLGWVSDWCRRSQALRRRRFPCSSTWLWSRWNFNVARNACRRAESVRVLNWSCNRVFNVPLFCSIRGYPVFRCYDSGCIHQDIKALLIRRVNVNGHGVCCCCTFANNGV